MRDDYTKSEAYHQWYRFVLFFWKTGYAFNSESNFHRTGCLTHRGEESWPKNNESKVLVFFPFTSLEKHRLITLNCSENGSGTFFSLSPTWDQGVTTHSAAACNSQPSQLASATTDLVWRAVSRAFGRASRSTQQLLKAGGNGWPSCKLALSRWKWCTPILTKN